jgi:hypothetical protein
MPDTTSSLQEETNSLLETMSAEKREYLLWRLATDKLAGEQTSGPIPVRRPDDGTVVGYLRKVVPPSDEDKAVMIERAKRMDPSAGRGTRELLDRMRAGDVDAVKKFIW